MKLNIGKYDSVSYQVKLKDNDDAYLLPVPGKGTCKLIDTNSQKTEFSYFN